MSENPRALPKHCAPSTLLLPSIPLNETPKLVGAGLLTLFSLTYLLTYLLRAHAQPPPPDLSIGRIARNTESVCNGIIGGSTSVQMTDGMGYTWAGIVTTALASEPGSNLYVPDDKWCGAACHTSPHWPRATPPSAGPAGRRDQICRFLFHVVEQERRIDGGRVG